MLPLSPTWGTATSLRQCLGAIAALSESEGHCSFHHDLSADSRDAMHDAHPRPQPLDDSLNFHDVTRMHRSAITHTFNSDKIRQSISVFWFGKNQNCTDLRHGLGQDCRWQHRDFAHAVSEIPFTERHILNPDDSLVRNKFSDAIDEQERKAVREDSFNSRVIERESNIHRRPREELTPS
jgi:hypothetical protein